MPVSIRPSGKARDIAYAIMGTPDNLIKKKKSRKKVDTKVLSDITFRMR